ncbi:sugar ABC transporter [Luteimicrobium album]|uniref:Sugar ABC transporter n=1 Tax=Luteimicrobium album TaxID=1054550 RepID=A0ABQ6I4C9_9MICO|nr:substrate-binding domain-containing protein [Luteimicrobium album]GMA24818.1 sugar ABC transporter [Luteimicrobium album]
MNSSLDGRCSRSVRALAAAAALGSVLTLVAACDRGSSGGSGGDSPIKMALVGVDLTNPYYLKMKTDAEAEAKKLNVSLSVQTVASGAGADVETQQIESAVASGAKAILVMPFAEGINPAIKKARDAGVVVYAVDNPTNPTSAVDMSYVTGNRVVGKQLGAWVAAKVKGEHVNIAMLDVFADQTIPVDIDRDQGFLAGMGIDVKDENVKGDEAASGSFDGGTYTVICHQPTQATQDGGRTAMENCLSKNPDVNVVYTINEPSAFGAYQALKAAGKTKDVTIATFDGSCDGIDAMKRGELTVDAQTYPGKMAQLAMQAAVAQIKDGTKPSPSDGLDYYNSGSSLVTDDPISGVDSITSAEAAKLCF